jgi:hypothetical protein
MLFASLVHDLKMHYVDDERIHNVISTINAELTNSFGEEDIQRYLIEPFADL